MKKENSHSLEKILFIVAALASVLIYVAIPDRVAADTSKYGTVNENEEAKREAQELAAKHEEGMEKGTAGNSQSTPVVTDSGSAITSNVSGCYNTRQFGGGVAIAGSTSSATNTAETKELESALSLGSGESAYAYVMDSSCGPAAKGALYAAAASQGYPAGPILDINIGKKTAAGTVEYPNSFAGNKGTFMRYTIPAGFRMPGYEPAFICLLPDGTTELIPNLVGGAGSFGGIFIEHPKGVYMLTQVPAGSIQSLHDEYTLKHFNSYFGTNYTSLSQFGLH